MPPKPSRVMPTWSAITSSISSRCLSTSHWWSPKTPVDERDTVNSRRFANTRRRSSASPARPSVRTRHRDHYNSMAALLDAPAQHRPPPARRAGDQEMDNLRSAFGWSIETGDIARALELASSLMPLWLSRGRIQEGLAWFNAVLTGNASLDELAAAHARTCRSPTRPCSTRGSTPTTWSDAGTGSHDRARTRRSGATGPSTHRLLQRRRLRRRGGPADTSPRRSAWPEHLGTSGGCPSFSVSRLRPPWSPATTSHCGRPPRKGARSPTPSVTASDRVSAAGGSRRHTYPGRSDRSDRPVARGGRRGRGRSRWDLTRHRTPRYCRRRWPTWVTRVRPSRRRGAIESAAELGDVYIGAVYIEVDDRAPRRG